MKKTIDRVLLRTFLILFALTAAAMLLHAEWVLVPVLLWLFTRRELPHFTLWLLILGCVLRLAMLRWIHPEPVSDFAVLYSAAQSLLRGDRSFAQTSYFTLWSYQTAFVVWEAMLLRIWNSIAMIRAVNAVLSALSVCLVYRLALPYARRASAQGIALLLTVFPFALTLPAVPTNQIPSAFFLLLGVWLCASPDTDALRFWRWLPAGLSLAVGNILRPDGVILLVALFVWAVFRLLRGVQVRQTLLGMLALLVICAAVSHGADAAVRLSGLNENGLGNRLPGWKIVCGLNETTFGTYSEEDWVVLRDTLDENHHPTEATEAAQKQMIARRLRSLPGRALHWLYYKDSRLWEDDALSWALEEAQTSHPTLCAFTAGFDRGVFYIALLLALLGLTQRKTRSADALLPHFVFFAAVCAFLLIEVQPRYTYLPQLFLFAAAAPGLDALRRWQIGGKEESLIEKATLAL